MEQSILGISLAAVLGAAAAAGAAATSGASVLSVAGAGSTGARGAGGERVVSLMGFMASQTAWIFGVKRRQETGSEIRI